MERKGTPESMAGDRRAGRKTRLAWEDRVRRAPQALRTQFERRNAGKLPDDWISRSARIDDTNALIPASASDRLPFDARRFAMQMPAPSRSAQSPKLSDRDRPPTSAAA